MKQTLVATEYIKPGQAVVIENGLVRAAIPNVHNARYIKGCATENINKGDTVSWDPVTRVLRRKGKNATLNNA